MIDQIDDRRLDGLSDGRSHVLPARGQDRPDLLPGKSNNPVLGDPNRYFDVSSFSVPPESGHFGNVARNTITRPGLYAWNFSLFKTVPLRGERHSLSFRAELFNLLNHPNFSAANGSTFTNRQGSVNPSVGKITETVTSSRQIQFGLKYSF